MGKSVIAMGMALATLGVAASANAGTGCNHMINPFVWGCAPWDNNNGPQYPYYRNPPRIVRIPGLNVAAGTTLRVSGANLVDANSGRLVSQGGGNLVSQGGGNLVSQGGGNVAIVH